MTPDSIFDEADLNGLVDGRIDPSRATALARFLASDPESRTRIESWKRQNESLRTMFASVLSEPIPIRLMPASMPSRNATTPIPSHASEIAGRPPRRLPGGVVATSIGAALVGFVLGALASSGTGGFGFAPASVRTPFDLRTEGRGGLSSGLAERAASVHRTFLTEGVRPFDVTAAEGPKLLRWLQRRLGTRTRVPDLSSLGWTVLGGHLVPDRQGPAAFLVYGNGADRLGLTVVRTPSAPDGDTMADAEVDTPLDVSVWTDSTYGYALTSDRGAAWLERNGGPLRDAIKDQLRIEPATRR